MGAVRTQGWTDPARTDETALRLLPGLAVPSAMVQDTNSLHLRTAKGSWKWEGGGKRADQGSEVNDT